MVGQAVSGDDLLDERRHLTLPVRRQVGEQVVLDVCVQAAVEDPEVRAVLEGHLLLENAHQRGVQRGAAQEVAGAADLAPVVLVVRLIRPRIGEHLHLPGVMLDGDQEQHRGIAGHTADVVGQHGRQEPPAHRQRLGDESPFGVGEGDPEGARRVSRDQNRLPSTSLVMFATRNGASWDRSGNTAPSSATWTAWWPNQSWAGWPRSTLYPRS